MERTQKEICLLNAITIPSAKGRSPQALLLLLHGWGANAQDVAGLSPYLNLPDYQMSFPDAPFAHPQAFGGKMWYGFPQNFSFINTPNFDSNPELVSSRQLLTEWIGHITEATGVPLSRTILGGFSQGAAMTLDVGTKLPLAGLMVLSGYLHTPLPAQVATLPPVLIVHGRQDPVVPLVAAQQAKEGLLALGAKVQYHEFEMGHEIQLNVLETVQAFVSELLPTSELASSNREDNSEQHEVHTPALE